MPSEEKTRQSKAILSGSIEDQMAWWWNIQQHRQSSQESTKRRHSELGENGEIP